MYSNLTVFRDSSAIFCGNSKGMLLNVMRSKLNMKVLKHRPEENLVYELGEFLLCALDSHHEFPKLLPIIFKKRLYYYELRLV